MAPFLIHMPWNFGSSNGLGSATEVARLSMAHTKNWFVSGSYELGGQFTAICGL